MPASLPGRSFHIVLFEAIQSQPLDDLVLEADIDCQASTSCCLRGKPVAALILFVACMPLDPDEGDFMLGACLDEPLPQVGISALFIAKASPILPAPALSQTFLHALDENL